MLAALAALAAATVVGADDEAWIELTAAPRPIVVDREIGRDESFVSLDLVNRGPRAVRVASVAITYLKGDSILATRTPGEGFFAEGPLPRAKKIEGGSRESWTGICLEGMPAEADRVRFDLSLAMRRGFQVSRAARSIDVAVEAAPTPVAMRLPFRGHWRVTQGHGCGSNHRLGARGAEFAWDFACVDRDDTGRHGVAGASFGREVLAPVGGRVVRVVSDVEDNRDSNEYPRRSLLEDLRRPDWVYGNYVVIESAGRYVLLGHLEKGSPAVVPGDLVEAGSVVARAGNSGNAMSAHLHVHVMDRSDPGDPLARGAPARLTTYVEIRAGADGREIVVRRVDSGDPIEASVVAADVERGRRERP